jgi:hypothetical protein
MPRSILTPFKTFADEGATVGRLLAGYSNIEVSLMHCVQMVLKGDLNTVIKKMFGSRGETKRIKAAKRLGEAAYDGLGLGPDFRKAIGVALYCLKIRNQYAHWVWWDDNTGKLAFANLEDLGQRKRRVRDLTKLKAWHIDATLLAKQEAFFVYADDLLSWINFEGRYRSKVMRHQPLSKPKPMRRPKLRL